MNRIPVLSFVVLLGLAASPAATPTRRAEAGTTKVVAVLFDLSGSTQVREVRERYQEDFKKVLAAIKPGDAVVGDGISDNPLAQSTFPINEEFDPYSPLRDNPLVHKKKVAEQRERALKAAEALLFHEKQRVPSTKILDSLHLAARIFAVYKRDVKLLVLFSDMVEESEQYNLRKAKLTDARIGQIIAQEKAKGRLPDLQGARVYVTGAAAGSYQDMSSDALFKIRDFWVRYFKACGADLASARYGSSLPKFEE